MSKKNKATQPSQNENTQKKVTSTATEPIVEEVKVEEVTKETTENIPTSIDINNIKLKPDQYMSGDGYARLLDVAQRHLSKMKTDESATIKMEQAFNYNMAWAMTKATIQAREEKIEIGIAVPNDDIIVKDIIETFNNLGVALSPHEESSDGKQLTLGFDSISKETEKAAKAENKEEKAQITGKDKHKEPELDPTKWTNDDEAKQGLWWSLTRMNSSFPNRFSECLMKVKLYRQNQEKDAAKKATWDQIGLGSLFEDAIHILGNKATMLMRGLCQGAVASLVGDHNPIFAHSTIKYNLPMLSEEEIADLVKSFIKVRNTGDTPVDESLAVKNGILEPSRQFFLDVPINSHTTVSIKDDNYNNVCLAKKIMNKFVEAYKDQFDKTDPQYNLKVTNKMIEIRNLYVDKGAAYAEYTEAEYPSNASAALAS